MIYEHGEKADDMAMRASLGISRTWFDEHVAELELVVNDGSSRFVSSAYDAPGWLAEVADQLARFGNDATAGEIAIQAGMSGSQSFGARLRWARPGVLHVGTWQESERFDFAGKQEARQARMFLRSEPALLDRFIMELRRAHHARDSTATLRCVGSFGC